MKKAVVIGVLATLLFAGCQKEEHLIIGEWTLDNVGKPSSIQISPNEWVLFFNDDNANVTFIFKKNNTYKSTRKEESGNKTEDGNYFIKDHKIHLENAVYDIEFSGKDRMILSEDIKSPSTSFTYFFKKVK